MMQDDLLKNAAMFAEAPKNCVSVHSQAEFVALSPFERLGAMPALTFLSQYPIQECGEPMVPLAAWLRDRGSHIQLVAGAAAYGAQSLETHMLRVSVAERLVQAEKNLQTINPDFTFKITDSFRPIALQQKYFDEIYARFAKSGLSGDALYHKVTQVISDPKLHPPHSTGGTVDLTIFDFQQQVTLDMGSALDDVDDPRSYTFHPAVVGTARQNRVLLYTAMTEAGFSNSPSEWWHCSYGDQEWALRTGQPFALYDSYRNA